MTFQSSDVKESNNVNEGGEWLVVPSNDNLPSYAHNMIGGSNEVDLPHRHTDPLSLDLLRYILSCTDEYHVISARGTSQYTRGGSSACGPACLNACVTLIAGCQSQEQQEQRTHQLCEAMISDVTEICSFWNRPGHLEAIDIHRNIPLFNRQLKEQETIQNTLNRHELRLALVRLREIALDQPTRAAVAVMTRPPETLCIFVLPTGVRGSEQLYGIFDSHPRVGIHPDGAAFILFPNLDSILRYLLRLFNVETNSKSKFKAASEDGWDDDFLHQFRLDIFTGFPVGEQTSITGNSFIYETSLRALAAHLDREEGKEALREAKTKTDNLEAQIRSHEQMNRQFQIQIQRLQEQNQNLHSSLRERLNAHPPSSSHTSAHSAHHNHSAYSARNGVNQPQTRNNQGVEMLIPGGYPSNTGNAGYDSGDYGIFNGSSSSRIRDLGQRLGAWGLGGNAGLSIGGGTSNWQHASGRSVQGPTPPSRAQVEGSDDAAFARQLQMSFDAENESILLDQRRLVEEDKVQTFQCSACMETLSVEDVFSLEGCEHRNCRDCVKGWIDAKLGENTFPISCLSCTGKDSTEITLHHAELVLDEAGLQLWTKLSNSSLLVAIQCPGCRQHVNFAPEDVKIFSNLTCPLSDCKVTWHKECRQIVDPRVTHSCNGDLELDRYAAANLLKRCPGCTQMIQKSEGCNHMTCTTPGCNTHFCYTCGEFLVRTNKEARPEAVNAHFRKRCNLFHYPAE